MSCAIKFVQEIVSLVAIEFSGWKAPLVTRGFQEYTFQQTQTEAVFINLVILCYCNTVLYIVIAIM